MSNRAKKDILDDLVAQGFDMIAAKKKQGEESEDEEEEMTQGELAKYVPSCPLVAATQSRLTGDMTTFSP